MNKDKFCDNFNDNIFLKNLFSIYETLGTVKKAILLVTKNF